jgi:hypothetical protein
MRPQESEEEEEEYHEDGGKNERENVTWRRGETEFLSS